MSHVDEELATTGLGTAGVGHGKSSGCVRNALVILSNFIWDGPSSISFVSVSVATLERSMGIGATGSGATTVGILRVRAAKLVHKIGDHTVEMLGE